MRYPSQLPVADAIEVIRERAPELVLERVLLSEAYGRILASDLESRVAHPSLDNSALDGFACRAEDTRTARRETPITLRVVGEVPAGRRFGGQVGPGEAVHIYTGAPVPEGANAIVRVEDTELSGDSVRLFAPARAEDIRPQGQDFAAGAVLLRAGERLDAAALGLAAAMGHAELTVARRPRVGILTTGDEIIAPGEPILPGQVYDANAYALEALVLAAGAAPRRLPRVADDPARLAAVLEDTGDLDLLLTSGGVSMGRYDFVRDLVFERGEVWFWKVAMRPAGPALFGRYAGVSVLGLPGNPVSSMIAFLVLAYPFLQRALGSREPIPYERRLRAVAGEALSGTPNKETFARVRLAPGPDGRLTTRSTGSQSSGVLSSMRLADALAMVPPGGRYAPGEALEVIVLEPFLG